MKVVCPSCSAKYQIDETRVPEKGVRLRCKGCEVVFRVTVRRRKVEKDTADSAVPLPGGGEESPDAGTFGSEGEVPLPGGEESFDQAFSGGESFGDESVPLPGAGEESPDAGTFGSEGEVPLPGGEESFDQAFSGVGADDESAVPESLVEDQAEPFVFEGSGAPEEGESSDPFAASEEQPSAPEQPGEEEAEPFVLEGSGEPEESESFDPFAASEEQPSSELPGEEEDPFMVEGSETPGGNEGGAFDPFDDDGGAGLGEGLPQKEERTSYVVSKPEESLQDSDPEEGIEEGAEEDLFDFMSQDEKSSSDAAAGEHRYEVRRQSGKTFGPFSASRIASMVKDGQLTGDEEVSWEERPWEPMKQVPQIAAALASEASEDRKEPRTPPSTELDMFDSAPAAETSEEASRTGRGYGVFGMSPTSARAEDGPLPFPQRLLGAARRRLWLLIPALFLLGVAGFGVYLGFTPYGWFGYNFIVTPDTTHRPAGEVIQQAQAGISEGTWHGYRNALAGSREALLVDSRDVEARSTYSQAAFYLERLYGGYSDEVGVAVSYLEEQSLLARDHPEHVKALMGRAILEGRPSDARAALQGVLEERPDDIEAQILMAESYFESRNRAEVSRYLQKVLETDPGNAKALHAFGRFYEMLGGEHLDLAIEHYEQALQAEPKHVDSAFALAALLLQDETVDANKAEKVLAIIDELPDHLLSPSQAPRREIFRGVWLTHKRSWNEAAEVFDSLLGSEDSALHGTDEAIARAAFGRMLLARGDHESALEHLDHAVKGLPDDVDLIADRVEALVRTGRIGDAAGGLRDLESKARGDIRVPYLRGLLAWRQDEHDDALGHLTDARKQDPEFYRAALFLGRLHIQRGRTDLAEAELRAAVEVAPSASAPHQALGDYFLEVGESGTAKESFSRALELDDENVEAWVGMARAHAKQGDDDEVKAAFDKAASIASDHPALVRHRGAFRWSRGNYEDALEDLRQALKTADNDAEVRTRLGAVLYELGELDEAKEHLEASLGIDGQVGDTLYYLGLVMAGQGERRFAMDRIRRAIEQEPENADFIFALGRLHEEARDYNDALTRFQRTVEIDPGYVDAWIQLGDVHSLLNRHSEAAHAYLKARELREDDPDIAMRLADTYVKWGRGGEAVKWYGRAIALDPDTKGAHFSLARALQTEGAHDRARQAFREALRREPEDPMPHYFLGYAYKDAGNNQRALSHFRSFLEEVGPDHPSRLEVEDEVLDLSN